MAFARKYESWEVRAIMQNSEGKASPVTGAQAHSRVYHGATTDTGKMSQFGSRMIHRTHKAAGESNSQWKSRGGSPKTSAFDNLIFQATAVAQALNSPTGQSALAVFDNPSYSTLKLRLTLVISGIEESDFMGTGRAPGMRMSDKHHSTAMSVPGAAGVRVIVDKGPATTEPFIQTCFPLDVCSGSSYEVKDMVAGTVVASG